LARAFAFAGGTLALGVVTSVFSLGPVVGFSGVVFALAGFALVRYPLATVVALVGADALEVMYRALVSPTVVQ
jgi:membrane associated rhomboid family serine protease